MNSFWDYTVFYISTILILYFGEAAKQLERKSIPPGYNLKKKVVTETFYKEGGLKKRITEIIERTGFNPQQSAIPNCSKNAQPNSNKNRKPNIVLILADDLGWNDVGWHNPEVITPNMDKLAREGIILKNSYVQPVCTPSRAAILTGKYPHRLGLQYLVVQDFQWKTLPRNETILSEKLKELGYSTHIVGKWHLGQCSKDMTPTKKGFDSFDGMLRGASDYYNRTWVGIYDYWKDNKIYFPPSGSYNTDLFTERATEIINESKPDESPLFLYLPHTSPHFPIQVPKNFKDMYPNIKDPTRQTYLGMVSNLDESVGKVVAALEQKNMIDNTIIVFLSDNGGDYYYGASNLPLRGDKGDLYEGGTKSVGFVYSPLLQKGGCLHKGLIHAVDWFPTILELAGYPSDQISEIDGVSQWKYLRNCQGSGRKEIVYGLDDYISNTAAIRHGRYKLILGEPEVYDGIPPIVEPINPNSKDVRLYDLHTDPFEKNNIAERRPNKVDELRRKLDRHRQNSIPAQNGSYVSSDISQKDGVLHLDWC